MCVGDRETSGESLGQLGSQIAYVGHCARNCRASCTKRIGMSPEALWWDNWDQPDNGSPPRLPPHALDNRLAIVPVESLLLLLRSRDLIPTADFRDFKGCPA